MIQRATGKAGHGYEIMFTAKGMPAELEAQRAALMEVPAADRGSEDFKKRVTAFNDGIAAWQKDGQQVVAHLIVDGVLKGEHNSGQDARDAASDHELEACDASEEGFVPLQWRTE